MRIDFTIRILFTFINKKETLRIGLFLVLYKGELNEKILKSYYVYNIMYNYEQIMTLKKTF